jgi:two-component system nitrate/nitrite response regulator NarL
LSLEDAIAEARATAPAPRASGDVEDIRLLTPREREVAILIGRGYSNRRIATHIVVGESTVATPVQHILAKLGLGSRAQVAVRGAQRRLLDEPSS